MRYTTAEVASLVQWTPARVQALVRAGLLEPQRTGRHNTFGFRDVIILRTARALEQQGVKWASLRRALSALRARLPEGQPLSALRLSTHGQQVAVDEGGVLYEPFSGQTLMRFDPAESGGASARTVTLARPPASEHEASAAAEALYERALGLEDEDDIDAAIACYQACLQQPGQHAAAQLNLGRLLQSRAQLDAARQCYLAARNDAETAALAWFNLGTLEEDCGQIEAAMAAYRQAAEAGVIDAHYNLARLHEQRGERDAALQQLMRFSRAERGK